MSGGKEIRLGSSRVKSGRLGSSRVKSGKGFAGKGFNVNGHRGLSEIDEEMLGEMNDMEAMIMKDYEDEIIRASKFESERESGLKGHHHHPPSKKVAGLYEIEEIEENDAESNFSKVNSIIEQDNST